MLASLLHSSWIWGRHQVIFISNLLFVVMFSSFYFVCNTVFEALLRLIAECLAYMNPDGLMLFVSGYPIYHPSTVFIFLGWRRGYDSGLLHDRRLYRGSSNWYKNVLWRDDVLLSLPHLAFDVVLCCFLLVDMLCFITFGIIGWWRDRTRRYRRCLGSAPFVQNLAVQILSSALKQSRLICIQLFLSPSFRVSVNLS